jgi:hypothetical protein
MACSDGNPVSSDGSTSSESHKKITVKSSACEYKKSGVTDIHICRDILSEEITYISCVAMFDTDIGLHTQTITILHYPESNLVRMYARENAKEFRCSYY